MSRFDAPLHLQDNVREEIEELIRRVEAGNVDLEARNNSGQTPLHFALAHGHMPLVKLLLEHGADANALNAEDETPMFSVIRKEYKVNELVPLLIKHGANVFDKHQTGTNALFYLAYKPEENINAIRALMENGVSLVEQDADLGQYKPIHLAVQSNKNELVKLYLDLGANVNAQLETTGESPLYIAVHKDSYLYNTMEVTKTLLKRGANVNIKTVRGRTALHEACFRAKEKYTKLLLSAGADVLIEDCNGKTPFALVHFKDIENPNIKPLIKALALKKACLQSLIQLEDERVIEENPGMRDYYQDCCACISGMKIARFTDTCTLFELLKKNRRQIAKLMRNPEFKADKFKLYDLSEFPMYTEDLEQAFKRAQRLYQFMMEWEDVINEAVYYALPDVVVGRVILYLCNSFEYMSFD